MMTAQNKPAQLDSHLPGYRLLKAIYTSSRTIVYKAMDEETEQPVVIKVMRQDFPNFHDLVQFRNQYAITQTLDIPGIVHPLSLQPWRNGYALVMEDWGGVSLRDFCRSKSLSLLDILRIAIQLAEILHDLAQQRVVHKDIKPANILIHPEAHQVKLIDFSIASVLPRETQEILNPSVLGGTLAYLAPEQTGRMNRGIDYRADFYGLGVTLYELLTRRLPFLADDPLELVHCHLAKAPIPLDVINPDVPKWVSAVVLKLMAKNAEDRYQSALGLKHDLQQCLSQWRDTGAIALFELGKRDICDRFLIPEKLYGREQEVQRLLEAFERVATGGTELILVEGFSGIGKTAVVNEVHKPITRQQGYFIKGKFDQLNQNIPLSAFVQALRDLVGQLLSESDAQLAHWRTQILAALGENGQVLIDVIPELEQVIGPQPPVPELPGSANQHRFNRLLQRFLAGFAAPEHPLVIFVDDLQWADSASLNLLELLMAGHHHLLIMGAYRNNEVSPIHPLMLMVAQLQAAQLPLTTITLSPLTVGEANRLVADTLKCSTVRSQPITDLILRKTQGNPFFIKQFLKVLHHEGQITFNATHGHWECDITTITTASLTNSVVELMLQQLQKLPEATQDTLKLAACIGNQFDLAMLAIVAERSETATADALWPALQAGLVLPQSEVYKFYLGCETIDDQQTKPDTPVYRFLHDRVQQAAYTLIPEQEQQQHHYGIGKLLLEQIPATEHEERVFDIVTPLNHGHTWITDPQEQLTLAHLNWIAARKARAATAYAAALDYAKAGLLLLGDQAWQAHYDLSLKFHELAAESASLCGDTATMEQFIAPVVAHGQTFWAKLNVYRLQIGFYISQQRIVEALRFGQARLEELGITVPDVPTQAEIEQSLNQISQLLEGREILDLVALPRMEEPYHQATLEIANSMIPAAYLSGSPLYAFLVVLTTRLSIQHGNTPISGAAYATYSSIVANVLKDIDTAAEFGQLALQVIERFEAKALKPEVTMVIGMFIAHRNAHLKTALPLLQEGYTAALEVGNLEYVGYNAYNYCLYCFWVGQPLTKLEPKIRTYSQELIQLQLFNIAHYCQLYWQVMLCLGGATQVPHMLSGEACQEEEILPQLLAAQDLLGVCAFHLCKLLLGYLFEEFESAQAHARSGRQYLRSAAGTFAEAVFYFYDSLLVLAPLTEAADLTPELQRRLAENQTRLQKDWATHAPMNHQHKVALVEAEQARVLGQQVKALQLYDQAIAGAKRQGYLPEEALANERAALFFLDWDKPQVAAGYLQEAYYCYARWGAQAKVAHLEQTYAQLLGPILQNPTPTIAAQTTVGQFLSRHTSQHTSSNDQHKNSWLDFPAVLKAAQAISQEIELEKVVATLMQIAIANAGAQQGHLILNRDKQWMVVARATQTQAELCNINLEHSQDLPTNLIYSVAHTQTTAVFDNLSTATAFANHPYVLAVQPKSALCMPLSQQGKLVGLLYLENNLTVGTFTSEQLELLQLLTSQAAISLENARLYQKIEHHSRTLETEVQHKTQDLEQALQQLRQSNQELARATRLKDEFLANMSHELRTPLNAILGMTEGLQDQMYGSINAKQASMLQTIERSGTHLLELINDVLDVAKIESGQIELALVPTALAPLCQASLAFIKQQAYKKRIQLDTKLPEALPELLMDERRIRQVLINLLNNAVKFTPEGGKISLEISRQCYPAETEDIPPRHFLKVAIQDTGIGIAQEHIQRLFQPFIQIDSALNRQYSGTGLGLSLVKRIVDLHGGQVQVTSEEGVGSCFSFELPYYPVASVAPPADGLPCEPATPQIPAQDRPPLILMAEDNEANISTLSCYLEAKGYRLILARNGREALELVQVEPPDLILMDIQMPEMDGIEAMQHIRRNPQTADVPIIALTALAMSCDRDRCLAAGANEYLSKPVKLKQLSLAMQSLLTP